MIALAGSRGRRPAGEGPLELAALTAALLLAFELTLTHWSYLYLPWVLPFVLLALTLPREPGRREAPRPSVAPRPPPALAASGVFVAAAVAVTVAWQLLGDAITDIPLYRTYGERIADGLVPYRDFAFEYPRGACRPSSSRRS